MLRWERECSFWPQATFIPMSSPPPTNALESHNPFQNAVDEHHSIPRGCLHDLSLVMYSQCQMTTHLPSCPPPKISNTFCASVTIWEPPPYLLTFIRPQCNTQCPWVDGLMYFITHTHTQILME